jgi:UDP-glucose 4-epimerase
LKCALITGAHGFLGRHAGVAFSKSGYTVTGIGHGSWRRDEYLRFGITKWIGSDVTLDALRQINDNYDVIFHCCGGGSVGYSVLNPFDDYQKTVASTAAVLEYMRLHNPRAKLIYPSTPAVNGDYGDLPIVETSGGKPVSPYGLHKKMSEDICRSYQAFFKLSISIIRFFSIYGPGLRKQLLWDACNKFASNTDVVEFWGTGSETRDWLYIDDATSLVIAVANTEQSVVVNGGTGEKHTISETLEILKKSLSATATVSFNGKLRIGDPLHYWADVSKASAIGWRPSTPFSEGITKYTTWYRDLK